jgi:hypothetical protein
MKKAITRASGAVIADLHNITVRREIGRNINVCLGDDLLTQVDQYAEAEDLSRDEAIRQLVQRGPHGSVYSRHTRTDE